MAASEQEIWKTIPGWENYAVSNLGRVKCVKAHHRTHLNRIMRVYTKRDGYKCVRLTRPVADSKNLYVHRLVVLAFYGPPPAPEYQCAHLDGDRANPKLDNLAWTTRRENKSHEILHGTRLYGSKNHNCKLRDIEVVAIRELCTSKKVSIKTVAACFAVSSWTVGAIRNNKRRVLE